MCLIIFGKGHLSLLFGIGKIFENRIIVLIEELIFFSHFQYDIRSSLLTGDVLIAVAGRIIKTFNIPVVIRAVARHCAKGF